MFQLQQCVGASLMLATHSSFFNCRHAFRTRVRSTFSSLSSAIQYSQSTSWPQMKLARMGEPCINARDMCRKEKLPQSRMKLVVVEIMDLPDQPLGELHEMLHRYCYSWSLYLELQDLCHCKGARAWILLAWMAAKLSNLYPEQHAGKSMQQQSCQWGHCRW